jgi:FAD/FMN-containing dehydrogenase
MQDVHLTRLDGSTITIAASAVEALASGLRVHVLTTTAAEYDDIRTIWNAMIDRRPGLIIRCHGVADVMHAVRFARDRTVLVAVRGGGHNIAGSALCDGGLVIDLSAMTSVRVDPTSRGVWVEPRATLGEVDRETQEFGRPTTHTERQRRGGTAARSEKIDP